MWNRLIRLFTIKTKFEAFMVIYALGLGAVERGLHYHEQYPGFGGWLLFAACPIAVFMAGARILDSVERRRDDSRLLPRGPVRLERRHEPAPTRRRGAAPSARRSATRRA